MSSGLNSGLLSLRTSAVYLFFADEVTTETQRTQTINFSLGHPLNYGLALPDLQQRAIIAAAYQAATRPRKGLSPPDTCLLQLDLLLARMRTRALTKGDHHV